MLGKMKKGVGLLLVCCMLLLITSNAVVAVEAQQLDLRAALTAYREFLVTPQTFEREWGNIYWDMGSILHAELVDFDNDGLPELFLIVEPNDDWAREIGQADLFVISYNGSPTIIYSMGLSSEGGQAWSAGLAYSSDGQVYFIHIAGGTGMYDIEERDYRALRNGEWVSILTTEIWSGWDSERQDFTLQHFYVNGIRVSEEQLNSSLATLGITRTREFRAWGRFDIPKSIQGLLSELDSKLVEPQQEATLVHDNNPINVTIDGQQVNFPVQQPTIVDGRTLVPVRGVFEALGFTVGWNNSTRTATLARSSHVVVITIDSDTFTTNGTSHTLDVPAQIIGGSTMLPIRAVVESVGYYIDWDAVTNTVIISRRP